MFSSIIIDFLSVIRQLREEISYCHSICKRQNFNILRIHFFNIYYEKSQTYLVALHNNPNPVRSSGTTSIKSLYPCVIISGERSCLLRWNTFSNIYHRGSGSNRNKFMIYFDSGGYCKGATLEETLQQCYRRTNLDLGTSKFLPSTADLDKGGVLSTQQQLNPVFCDWTKIFVVYCDGSEHTGTRIDPISFKEKQLYFRGHNNTLETFNFLDEEFDFYNGETIVITGVSAGGTATFLYSNYLIQHTKTAKVYALPDSGFFITQYFSPFTGQQEIRRMASNLLKITHEEGYGFPFPQCFQQYEEYFMCYNAANLAKYQKAPMFIIESPYDQYSIDEIVVALCKSQKAPFNLDKCNQTARSAIEDYRKATIQAIKRIKGNRNDVGAWSPSCVQHGFVNMNSYTDPRFKVPSVGGPMLYEAIAEFLANPLQAKMYIDAVSWPYSTACNGQDKKQLSVQ